MRFSKWPGPRTEQPSTFGHDRSLRLVARGTPACRLSRRGSSFAASEWICHLQRALSRCRCRAGGNSIPLKSIADQQPPLRPFSSLLFSFSLSLSLFFLFFAQWPRNKPREAAKIDSSRFLERQNSCFKVSLFQESDREKLQKRKQRVGSTDRMHRIFETFIYLFYLHVYPSSSIFVNKVIREWFSNYQQCIGTILF